MHITNVRLGFATNSSSSHSILIFPGNKESENWYGDGFGWETFTLTTEHSKLKYMLGQLSASLRISEDEEHSDDIANALFSIFGDEATFLFSKDDDNRWNLEDDLGINVDHQSVWNWPGEFSNPSHVNTEFITDVAEFLKKDSTLILGGNDNGGTHPLYTEYDNDDDYYEIPPEGSTKLQLTELESSSNLVGRKQGDSWTLFNRGNGSKIRMFFGDPGDEPKYALTPELVDLKITDYCPFDCKFCYMDSDKNGKHASLAVLKSIVAHLSEAEVFEVAIGGGEPTLHPNFWEILDDFKIAGIVPNFTTKNLKWLSKPELVEKVKENCGSFAYSVQSAEDIKAFSLALTSAGFKREWNQAYPNVHIVMGTVSEDEFRKMLFVCKEDNITPTLLGFKRLGRATEPEFPYLDWWWKVANEAKIYRLGIDTTLAAESKEIFEAKKIPDYLYHVEDGKFSAYIDAVNETMAPSSWEPERGKWKFGYNWINGWIKSQSDNA